MQIKLAQLGVVEPSESYLQEFFIRIYRLCYNRRYVYTLVEEGFGTLGIEAMMVALDSLNIWPELKKSDIAAVTSAPGMFHVS